MAEVAAFGALGAVFLKLEFSLAPIILGLVLGFVLEENFRRAMLLSRGDAMVFFERPISAGFMTACGLLLAVQLFSYWRKTILAAPAPQPEELMSE